MIITITFKVLNDLLSKLSLRFLKGEKIRETINNFDYKINLIIIIIIYFYHFIPLILNRPLCEKIFRLSFEIP